MLHLHPSEPVPVPVIASRDRALRLHVSERDLRILLLARSKLQGARVDFAEAIRALREAVEESIPAGRIFLIGRLIGRSDQAPSPGPAQDPVEDFVSGPIIGSLVSGVGIAESRDGIRLLRLARDGRRIALGRFLP